MGYVRILATVMIVTSLAAGGVVYAQQEETTDVPEVESGEFGVGDALPAEDIHVISKPGLYGLGPEPANSKYAIAHDKLIRIDPESGKVLSILRSQAQILD